MTTPEALNALADRVEREEPSLELEEAIFDALGFEPFTKPFGNFLRSLDAAVTLVPEGRTWTLESASDESSSCVLGRRNWLDCHSIAKTPAAALTAAALRARAADMQARAEATSDPATR